MATGFPGRWPLLVVVGWMLVAGWAASPLGSPATPNAVVVAAMAPSAGGCGTALPSAGVVGEISVDGGFLLASEIVDMPLTYTYNFSYRTVEEPGNLLLESGCVQTEENMTVAANGSFASVPRLPSPGCVDLNGAETCTSYGGPFGPIGLVVAGGPPPGYAVSVVGVSPSIAVTLVYLLASVTISPVGPTVTTSVGAPTTLTATAWAANGSRSTLVPSFSWAVNGTGWSLVGGAAGPSVALVAVNGASVAVVTVQAGAVVRTAELPDVESVVDLQAVSTQIVNGQANRTGLDVGGAVAIRLEALGAAGFSYTAQIAPGLGLAQVAVPCRLGPADDGVVEVACAANLTYAVPGTAQPTANVTNGYSSATWAFPQVVVHRLPAPEVSPASPIGYARSPIPVTVSVANGSGAPPFAQACLGAATVPTDCERTPGPAWGFDPTFASPGTYNATAWVADSTGANQSITFPVSVVAPLEVGPVDAEPSNATVGAPVELHAAVSGGALPARYWWNVSGLEGPLLDGELLTDGNLTVTDVPTVAGSLVVTVTVLDRLGTVVAGELLVPVGPAGAERVAPLVAPPADPVVVGTPVAVAWGAFDASGAADPSFAAPVELTVASNGAAPQVWANASAAGPLESLSAGTFAVPAAAWVHGVLNITVTVATAAEVTLGLSGAALPSVVPPMNLTAAPDLAHLRLFAPSVARGGVRENATLWRVEDRFGNPAPGALVTIVLSFGGARSDVVVAVVPLDGGGSGVWVNYSAPTAGGGEVTLLDAAGQVVLGPLTIPSAAAGPASDPAVDAVATAVPLGAAGVGALAVVRRRRRARSARPVEEELRQLAEGRARAAELIAQAGTLDLEGLESAWGGPVPPALADWLASLVADGTLRATVGEDGRPRFCLAEGPADGPHVTFDPEALDQSLRRRDEALAERDAESPTDP